MPILDILQHALGVDEFGQGEVYRNHFVAGPGHTDYADCLGAADLGLMRHYERKHVVGGHVFRVTEAGRHYVREHSPQPPKLTRSQRRYRDWLNGPADFMSFGDYLARKAA